MLAAAVGRISPAAKGGGKVSRGKIERLFIGECREFVMAGRVKIKFGNSLVIGGFLDLSHSFQKVEQFLPLMVVIAVCDGKVGQLVHLHLRHS